MVGLIQSHKSFYFLRHGETEANAADIIAGSLDSPLTARGLAQAETAAEILARHEIGAIWHSQLSRAVMTAQAVARKTGAPMFQLEDLAERHWGGWEGEPRSVLRRDEVPPGGGEGPDAFAARIRRALAQITGQGPILIVAHSGTAREIHNLLCDKAFTRLDNCEPVLWQQDDRCHWTFKKLS